ncbi:hypothetical protein CXQ81_09035 [Pseudomonas sp. 09C 129]|nr:hypothetical protein CXQ81_09035 [Pseudomonas sp. 09C 129]PMY62970.1 hypothetical protein C1Y31_20935 [Pseudomonas sp. FW305-25]PMY65781.1 hypothetical protein C1Y32_22370 [Pseudomonas sp. FW126-L8]PNA77201.1 hypothetical protein C1Y33_18465 [Pseudomonas sp. FW305-76]
MRWGSPNRFLLHAATPPDKNSCRSNSYFFANALAGHIEMSVKRLLQEASFTLRSLMMLPDAEKRR